MAAKIPVFRLPPAWEDTRPARVGPLEHPRSPASARRANIVVPPRGIETDAVLKSPGHIIPTENPQSAQPKRFNTGNGRMEIHK